MNEVHILMHLRPETERYLEDWKMIGVYSSREQAQAAISRVVHQPGFRDFPDGFEIFDYVLAQDYPCAEYMIDP